MQVVNSEQTVINGDDNKNKVTTHTQTHIHSHADTIRRTGAKCRKWSSECGTKKWTRAVDLPQKEVKRVTLQASLDRALSSTPTPPSSVPSSSVVFVFFLFLCCHCRCCCCHHFFFFCCSTANAKKYATKDEAQAKRKQHSHT